MCSSDLFWCVLLAGLLPYLATGIAKFGGRRTEPYDNRDPRAWLERQQGLARRADNAQKNGFETFPLFAAAVVVAHLHHVRADRLDVLAVAFVAARVLYLVCYLADWALPRSLFWTVGLGCCVGLFLMAV